MAITGEERIAINSVQDKVDSIPFYNGATTNVIKKGIR